MKTNPSLRPKKSSASCGAWSGSTSLVMLALLVGLAPFNACNAGSPPTKLTPSDTPGDSFATAVALENGVAVIGAQFDNAPAFSSGSAYVFVQNGDAWLEQKKLIPNDSAANDHFGVSVDIGFRTIVVGADYKATRRGAAYVFVSNGSNWTQQARFIALNPRLDDQFGHSVAISADTVLVGTPGNDKASCPNRFCNTGSVDVFVRFHGQWLRQEVLTASDAANSDLFGTAVAIDGNTAVVGTLTADAAYVFVRQGTTWSQQAKLLPSDTNSFGFGRAVSIHGNTIIVGAPQGFDGDIPQAGKAYVFVRNGTNWTEQAQLFASEPTRFANFGFKVSVNGNKALVGKFPGGAVDFFIRNGTTWALEDTLVSPSASFDNFGQAVSLSAGSALVGAPISAGTAYVFALSPAPQVNLTAADATASEPGVNTGQFRIARTGNKDDLLRVYYEVSGSATAGADYTSLNGFATIAPGRVGQLFQVKPIDNASSEPNETVKVTLLPDPGYGIGPANEAEVTITDDD